MERKYLTEWQKYINEIGPSAADQQQNAQQQAQANQPRTPANDGKVELVDSLIKSLNAMKTDAKYTALMVAKLVYNKAANWMNKTDYYANRPGEPTKTKAPYAPNT
jgi:hypothetical protein